MLAAEPAALQLSFVLKNRLVALILRSLIVGP
jgi:hypothetical protein